MIPPLPTTTTRIALPTPNARRHLSLTQLNAAFAAFKPRPTDQGALVLMVARRHPNHARLLPTQARLSAAGGMPTDRWATGDARPETQLAVMDIEVARLIANGQPLPLFGDNLYVDLDISERNLPAGTELGCGEVRFVVTPEPHDGCARFRVRFGGDALRFTAHKAHRGRRLRGVYFRVIRDGRVALGDRISVLSRP